MNAQQILSTFLRNNLQHPQTWALHTKLRHMQSYRYDASEKCGTPVVSSGSSHPGSKRFVCKHWKKHNCKYRFILKWDRFGYYIHLYGRRKDKISNVNEIFCIGCLWHDHDREAPSPFESYHCLGCSKSYKFHDIGQPCVECCKDTTS